MISFRELTVFRAVMKTGGVSGAARLLAVSQPSVTKTLQQIEWKIGVPLFERVRGRLRPTPDSLLLLPKVEQVFASVEDMERLATQIGDGNAGQISIATVSTLAAPIMATAVAQYSTLRPNVEVKIQALATRDVMDKVANNQVDFGLTDSASTDRILKTEQMCRMSICCVLRKDHPLANRAAIRLEDLVGEQIISFFEETVIGAELRHRLHAIDPNASIRITTNQSLVASALALQGGGIALIDPFIPITGYFPDLTIRPLEPRLDMFPKIVLPPSQPLSVAATELVDVVRQVFANLIDANDLIAKE